MSDELVDFNCNGLLVKVPKWLCHYIHKCRNLHLKIAKVVNHIAFLRRCRKHDIIPKCCEVKLPYSPRNNALRIKFGKDILRDQLNYQYHRKKLAMRAERETQQLIYDNVDASTWTIIWTWILVSEKEVFISIRNKQMDKFRVLCNQDPRNGMQNEKQKVYNFSSRNLTDNESKVLSKGLNFIPEQEIKINPSLVANTEKVARKLGPKGHSVAEKVKLYANDKPDTFSQNFKREDWIAIRNLKTYGDIIITNADKGKAVVVMNKTDYDNKMMEILSKGEYRRLSSNPILKEEKKLTKLLNTVKSQGFLEQNLVRSILHCNSNFPNIYGCPKVHKENIPLRPIIRTCGTSWWALGKYLCQIINPLAYPENGTNIRNTQEFVDCIRKVEIEPNDILLSLDVKNMFTSIPTNECLIYLKNLLLTDVSLVQRTLLPIDTIMELITACVKATFFKYENEFYEQKKGLPMGSPLSPALANVYMNCLEQEKMMKCELYKLVRMIKRFMDDYFAIWSGQRCDLGKFLKDINNLDENITFTMEVEANKTLPFLEILVVREGNRLNTAMYSKEYASNLMLNYKSALPNHMKINVVRNMIKKVENCSDKQKEDMADLKKKLGENQYPKNFVKMCALKKKSAEKEKEKTKELNLIIPYKTKSALKFKRAVGKLGMKVVFKRNKNIGELIGKQGKDRSVRNTNVVYKISCNCGDFYVGETGREVDIRVTEHKRAIRNGDVNNALAVHVKNTGHNIDFDSLEILAREVNIKARKFKEAYFIRLLGAKLNINNGYDLYSTWF